MINGKTAVITGASRGIGRAIALRFAKEGANIAIIYAGSDEKADEVVKEALSFGVKAEKFKCNVASFDECKETVLKIKEIFGGIDILVNNAGVTHGNRFFFIS